MDQGINVPTSRQQVQAQVRAVVQCGRSPEDVENRLGEEDRTEKKNLAMLHKRQGEPVAFLPFKISFVPNSEAAPSSWP